MRPASVLDASRCGWHTLEGHSGGLHSLLRVNVLERLTTFGVKLGYSGAASLETARASMTRKDAARLGRLPGRCYGTLGRSRPVASGSARHTKASPVWRGPPFVAPGRKSTLQRMAPASVRGTGGQSAWVGDGSRLPGHVRCRACSQGCCLSSGRTTEMVFFKMSFFPPPRRLFAFVSHPLDVAAGGFRTAGRRGLEPRGLRFVWWVRRPQASWQGAC